MDKIEIKCWYSGRKQANTIFHTKLLRKKQSNSWRHLLPRQGSKGKTKAENHLFQRNPGKCNLWKKELSSARRNVKCSTNATQRKRKQSRKPKSRLNEKRRKNSRGSRKRRRMLKGQPNWKKRDRRSWSSSKQKK